MPFLDDRQTWNSLATACRYFWKSDGDKDVCAPWPKCIPPPEKKKNSLSIGPIAISNRYLASGSLSGQIDIWDNSKGHIRTVKRMKGMIQSMAFDDTGTMLAACSTESKNPILYDIAKDNDKNHNDENGDGAFLELPLSDHNPLDGKSRYANQMAFWDGCWHCTTVNGFLWKFIVVDSPKTEPKGRQRRREVQCIQVYSLGISRWFSELLSLHHKWVATSAVNSGVVRVKNTQRKGENDIVLTHNARCITAMSISDTHIVTAGDHGIVQLWQLPSKDEDVGVGYDHPAPIHLHGLEAIVTSIDISPCGTIVAASDCDGHVLTWNAQSGRQLAKVGDPCQSIHTILFTSNGSMLVASGTDGTIRCWSRSELTA